MSTTILTSQIRPAATHAAAAAVGVAIDRLSRAAGLIARLASQLGAAAAQAPVLTRETLARRRDAQRVLELAGRFDATQPGFASDLRAAAWRSMD